ncbi:DnaJ domain-containing protein [Microbacterium aquimaris]|uniref:DnaJ domain-containing protein n=1 Tax=Microbacterium aquimaris TaxID=459816 RepID=UPI002AD42F24|nr:DnaJ domain-containing protein [Microbacterium aquimaris]MDZ8275110.1 DnaJ domain-containing protein [Microbacterium aquimaris]
MFDSPLSASAYDLLGVDPAADTETLRKAYRLKLRQSHPDVGGDAAVFVQVQRAWELVGTVEARASYDRRHGFGEAAVSSSATGASAPEPEPEKPAWSTPAPPRPSARPDTRPRARSHGQPGGWRREKYLELIREWVGRGVEIPDPYAPHLVRSAPHEVRRLLADALAEEATAVIVSELGMGYTAWHDIDAGRAKLDHIVLGPSGLYGILSEDFGRPVRIKRGEVADVDGGPIATHVAALRAVGRAARVKFGGAIVVLPDDDVEHAIQEIGKVRGIPTAVVARSALSTVLRRGVTGTRPLGGTEVFEIRTRLQAAVRFA